MTGQNILITYLGNYILIACLSVVIYQQTYRHFFIFVVVFLLVPLLLLLYGSSYVSLNIFKETSGQPWLLTSPIVCP